MNGDDIEIFRGHLDECLEHLAKCFAAHVPKGSKGASAARRPIADFCRVGEPAVSDWLSTPQKVPGGESRVRLMCFLDMLGYTVIELERLKTGRRGFTELAGYGLLSGKEATELLGYTDRSDVWRIFRPSYNMSEDKEQKMWDEWKKRKEELDKVKLEAREKYRISFPLNLLEVVCEAKQTTLAVQSQIGPVRLGLGQIMDGLSKLIDGANLAKMSGEELRGLFPDAGRTILQLSGQLSSLSSKLIATSNQNGGKK